MSNFKKLCETGFVRLRLRHSRMDRFTRNAISRERGGLGEMSDEVMSDEELAKNNKNTLRRANLSLITYHSSLISPHS